MIFSLLQKISQRPVLSMKGEQLVLMSYPVCIRTKPIKKLSLGRLHF